MEETKDLSSVKQSINQVENDILILQSNLRDYKKQVETTRAEIVAMESKISLSTDDTPKSISPQIDELMSDLRLEIQNQKDQNEHFQKQITGLKKEKAVLKQHIVAGNSKSQILEESVGFHSISG